VIDIQHRTALDSTGQHWTAPDSTGQHRPDSTVQHRPDSTGQNRTAPDSTGHNQTQPDTTGHNRTQNRTLPDMSTHGTVQNGSERHAGHKIVQNWTFWTSNRTTHRTLLDTHAGHSPDIHRAFTGHHRTSPDIPDIRSPRAQGLPAALWRATLLQLSPQLLDLQAHQVLGHRSTRCTSGKGLGRIAAAAQR